MMAIVLSFEEREVGVVVVVDLGGHAMSDSSVDAVRIATVRSRRCADALPNESRTGSLRSSHYAFGGG